MKYLVEDFNTHCNYEFFNYAAAEKKYKELSAASSKPRVVMTSLTPDNSRDTIIKNIVKSTI